MLLNLNVPVTAGLIGDVVAIVIILTFAIIASARGFFRCLLGFVGTVLSLLLAFLFCRTMAHSLQNWFGLLDKFSEGFTKLFMKIPAFALPIGENVQSSLESSSVPGFVITLIVKAIDGGTIPTGTTAAQLISPVVANMALLAISFLLIFLIVRLLCFILDKTLGEAMKKIPVVKSVNALLGFVLGAIEGLVLVYLILFVFAIFPFEFITNFVAGTSVISYFYHHNLLGLLISWAISTDWLSDAIRTLSQITKN